MDKEKVKNLEGFAKQLKLIVDSRIKRIEYNLTKVIMPYVPNKEHNHVSDINCKNSLPTFKSPKLYNEKLFGLIEDYTKRVCKLKFIKTRINKHNAIQVNDILETEEYLNWSKKELKAFFEGIEPSI